MSESIKSGWAINALLAVILVLLTGMYVRTSVSTAQAAGGGWETNGIMAINAQVGEQLILVNTDPNDRISGQNIMIYRASGGGKFRLIGARSYKYDIELVDTASTQQMESKYQQGATFRNVYDEWQNKDKTK